MGEAIGVVSLWLAKIDSEESLDSFTEITYTEDGSYKDSIFGKYFQTAYYDEGFKESTFLDKYSDCLSTLLEDFSYDEIVIPRFMELIPDLEDSFNAVIMLYNHSHNSNVTEYQRGSTYCRFFCHVKYN
jgi:Immunity protein 22